MELSRTAERYARRLTRRPDLPGWWPLLTVAIGVLFVGYVFWHLIAPAPKYSAGTAATTPGGVTATVPTAPTTPAPSGPTTTLTNTAGGHSVVPAQAASVAEAAGLAVYTTNFTGVPLAPGASLPPQVQAWPSASVLSEEVVSVAATRCVFAVTVDPAPGSPADPGAHVITVTVTYVSEQWEFSSSE